MRRCPSRGGRGNAKHREKRQTGTALPKRMHQDNRYGVPPIRAKRESIRRDDMAIYQAGTNDAPGNSIVTFFQTFERTKLYDLLAATPLIVWYGFIVIMQLPSLAHQIASLDLA